MVSCRGRVVRWGLAVATAGLALASAGCAALILGTAAAGGVAAVAYQQGDVPRDLTVPVEQAWPAAQAALGDLGLPVTLADRVGTAGVLESRTPEGDRVVVSVEPSPARPPVPDGAPVPPATRVRVRVGTFGDANLSERILDQVEARLGRPGGNAGPPPFAAPTAAVSPVPLPRETAPPPLAQPVSAPPPAPSTPATGGAPVAAGPPPRPAAGTWQAAPPR